MKNTVKPIIFGALLVTQLFSSCKHDIPELTSTGDNGGGNGNGNGNGSLPPCNPDTVYFQQQVLPILVSNCTSSNCHNSIDQEGGIDLTSFAAVMASNIVEIGQAWNSDLVKSITETNPNDLMPPPTSGSLTNAQVNLIKKWINQGAQDLLCDGGCDTSNVTYSGTMAPLMQTYCNGCHSGASPDGGIDLTNYTGVSGAAIDGSLYGSVIHNSNWSAMPKNSAQLPQCKIDQIRIWVNSGYPNN
jgi:hypothetical protein